MFLAPTLAKKAFRPSVNTKIIVDGNSIFAGHAGTQMGTLLAASSYFSGTEATIVNYAISGQTWQMMNGIGGSATDVDGAFVALKTNILICMETTNAVGNTNRTGAECYQDAVNYLAARKAAHPTLKIALCSALPRDGVAGFKNTNISICDDLMRANYRAIGADIFIDFRSGSSPFNHSGTVAQAFIDTQSIWAETSGWLHPNTAGQTIMANIITTALRRL